MGNDGYRFSDLRLCVFHIVYLQVRDLLIAAFRHPAYPEYMPRIRKPRPPFAERTKPIDLIPAQPGLESQIWERQKTETNKAFEAFIIYRDMGAERSAVKAEKLYRPRYGGKVPTDSVPSMQFQQWSKRYRWVERSVAYDGYMDHVEQQAQKRARVQTAKRHADQQAKLQEVILHPVDKYHERLQAIATGADDELESLDQVELIKLVRSMAALLPDSQKAEREALGPDVADGPSAGDLKQRADALRMIFQSGDLRGIIEKASFEVSQPVPTEEAS